MTTPADILRRLTRLESAPRRVLDVDDLTDAELLDIIGIGPEWDTMTEAERDEALGAIVARRA